MWKIYRVDRSRGRCAPKPAEYGKRADAGIDTGITEVWKQYPVCSQ